MMIKKLIKNTSGIALTEFALILPLFVFMVVGGMELAWEAVTRQKIQALASTSADNAARKRGVIDETDISEIIAAIKINGEGLDFEEEGRIIISSVQRNAANNGNWIRWQRCFGKKSRASNYGTQGKGQNNSSFSSISDDPNMRPPTGNAIIIAEIEYDHKPLVTDAYFGQRTFTYETVQIVRDRQDLGIGNATNIPASAQARC